MFITNITFINYICFVTFPYLSDIIRKGYNVKICCVYSPFFCCVITLTCIVCYAHTTFISYILIAFITFVTFPSTCGMFRKGHKTSYCNITYNCVREVNLSRIRCVHYSKKRYFNLSCKYNIKRIIH